MKTAISLFVSLLAIIFAAQMAEARKEISEAFDVRVDAVDVGHFLDLR